MRSRPPVKAGAPVRIRREDGGKDLDRDIAAEGRVVRAIDLAHAPSAEQAVDAIRPRALTDQRERRGSVHHVMRGTVEEVFRSLVLEQRFDLFAQRLVAGARLAQERRSRLRVALERCFEQAVHSRPSRVAHVVWYQRCTRVSRRPSPISR